MPTLQAAAWVAPSTRPPGALYLCKSVSFKQSTLHTSSSNGVHAVEFVFGLGLGLVEHADFLGYCKMICTELLWSMSKFKIFPHRDITCWDSRVEEGASPHLLPRNWQTYSHLPGLTRQGSMATPVAACSSKFVGGVSNRHSRHSVH